MNAQKFAIGTLLTLASAFSQCANAADTRTLPTTTISPISASTVSSVPTGAIPSEASLIKLMQVMQFDKTINDMFNSSSNLVDEVVKQAFSLNDASQQLTATQQAEIQQAVLDFTKRMLAEQNSPTYRKQLADDYIATAKTIYNQAEVNAMIDFYGSSLGQSIVAKQSDFGKAYMQKIMPTMMSKQQQTLQKYMPELTQKIDKITQQPKKTNKKPQK